MEFEKNPNLHSTPIEHINLQIFLNFVIWPGKLARRPVPFWGEKWRLREAPIHEPCKPHY